jgi:hypothetical protein
VPELNLRAAMLVKQTMPNKMLSIT